MKHLFTGMLLAFLLGACGNHEGHNHEHDGHDHEAEGHNHQEEAAHGHEDHEHEGHNHEAEAESHAGHSDEIILSKEKAAAAGVTAEVVQPGTFYNVITTSGHILAAQGDETVVTANVAGIVSFDRPITEGMQVSKNGTLFTLVSEHLQDGDPVKRARIAYETAKEELERAEKLVGQKIVSQKDFNSIKERYENARIAYEALAPNAGQKGVAIKAPIGGYLKSCLVKEGDYVSVGQPVASITQNRKLYLRADVSERYYGVLSTIRSANFKPSYSEETFSLKELDGRLLSYGKATDDAAYYIPVTFEFANRGNIVPGAFAEVYLLSDERQNVISLPVSAITEEQGLNFVYIQLDETCYKKQEVTLGCTDGNRVEITSGLKGGESVVTQGAIHVKLASASNAIPAHSHSH